jgi:hypothetical protein
LCGRGSGADQPQRNASETAKRDVEAPRRLSDELDPADLLRQSLQHYLTLKPRQQLSNAGMNPGPESDVPERSPHDVVCIGQFPVAGIPVGRSQK